MTLTVVDKPQNLVTRITDLPQVKILTQWVNPFILLFRGGSSVVELFVRMEASLFPEAKHNLLRETLMGIPGLAGVGRRPIVEDRAITDNLGIRPITDQLLERSRSSIPITLIIWIISWTYASSEEWRQKFISAVNDFGQVPLFTSEVFQKTRMSYAGQLYITPKFVLHTARTVCNLFGWGNTILDARLLYSDTGIQLVLQFFGLLNTSPGNYIPFVEANSRTLPPFSSGTTTTFGALGSFRALDSLEYLGNTLYALGGHSFGLTIKWVHLNDARLIAAYHNENNVSPRRDLTTAAIQSTSQLFGSSGSFSDSVAYIIRRTTGDITNTSGIPHITVTSDSTDTSVPTERLQRDRYKPKRERKARNVIATASLGDIGLSRDEIRTLRSALTMLGSLLPKFVHVPRLE